MSENAQAMSDSAVKAIQQSVTTVPITVDEINYTTRPVFAPPTEASAETLAVHTLTGLVDYLGSDIDQLVPGEHAIHIASPDVVNLVSVLFGRPKRRDILLSVRAESLGFRFGQFYPREDFNIALQSLFVDDADRAAVLKVIGNIKESVVGEYDDDGVTQSVVAKSGVARVSEVQVPNPVSLSPFRTFADVTQPTSPFVLRIKPGLSEGQMPTVALFEADGGKWRLAAIENIATYLRIKVAELTSNGMDKIAIIA